MRGVGDPAAAVLVAQVVVGLALLLDAGGFAVAPAIVRARGAGQLGGLPGFSTTLELRELFDHPSPFGDGLSFGQASEAGRPFRSDGFAETLETREPFDGVQFFDGLIAPGETVALSVVVTDTTPRWEFYLLQKRDSPLAGSTRPAWTGPG